MFVHFEYGRGAQIVMWRRITSMESYFKPLDYASAGNVNNYSFINPNTAQEKETIIFLISRLFFCLPLFINNYL